jgi:hypothetical protein
MRFCDLDGSSYLPVAPDVPFSVHQIDLQLRLIHDPLDDFDHGFPARPAPMHPHFFILGKYTQLPFAA